MPLETEIAERRFREAFARLKINQPHFLAPGTPVSQNNVAKEAGTDPSALRKSRYPALIREIQAYVETKNSEQKAKRARQVRQTKSRDNLKEKVKRLESQRDHAQSQLLSAQRLVLELFQEKSILQTRLDELLPPPTKLRP